MTSRIGFKGTLVMAAAQAVIASYGRAIQPYQRGFADYYAPPPNKLQGKPWSGKKAKKRGRK